MIKFIIKLHPEITIKSRSVRARFTKILEGNIKTVLRRIDEKAWVQRNWDYIEARIEDQHRDAIVDALKSIPGIANFNEVTESTFTDLEDIFQQAFPLYRSLIEGKTFKVQIKRRGKHEWTSTDMERYVGGGFNQHVESSQVKLNRPQVTIALEVDNDKLLLIKEKHYALGGFPIPSQEDVLSLISGGFDSGVASHLMIKRGARVHYLFFNLGGAQHEIGVKQVSHYLWQKFGASHRVRFISVDFQPVVAEILENIDTGLMGVVLKRMMMRAGTMVADKFNIKALLTGESVGQVSSQTITNLNVIDRSTETLIIRPLIHMDKQEIIDIARRIGTEQLAATMPEYCGVISKKPNVACKLEKVEAAEQHFHMPLLEQVVDDAKVQDIRDLQKEADQEVKDVEAVSELNDNDIILDIRAPDEEDDNPLEIDGVEVVHIPFYKLANQFAELDQSKNYLLFCQKGVMSKLQALYLHEQGYNNVKVFKAK